MAQMQQLASHTVSAYRSAGAPCIRKVGLYGSSSGSGRWGSNPVVCSGSRGAQQRCYQHKLTTSTRQGLVAARRRAQRNSSWVCCSSSTAGEPNSEDREEQPRGQSGSEENGNSSDEIGNPKDDAAKLRAVDEEYNLDSAESNATLSKKRLELILEEKQWLLQEACDDDEREDRLIEVLQAARNYREFCESEVPDTVTKLLESYIEVWVVQDGEAGFDETCRLLGLEEDEEIPDRLHCARDIEGKWRWLEDDDGRELDEKPKIAKQRELMSLAHVEDRGLNGNVLRTSIDPRDCISFDGVQTWNGAMRVWDEMREELQRMREDGWHVDDESWYSDPNCLLLCKKLTPFATVSSVEFADEDSTSVSADVEEDTKNIPNEG